jgi:hypothetical protein
MRRSESWHRAYCGVDLQASSVTGLALFLVHLLREGRCRAGRWRRGRLPTAQRGGRWGGPTRAGGAFAFRRARCPPCLWGGPAWMAGRGGAPLSPPLQPPLNSKRGVLAAFHFSGAARTPPGVAWGVRASTAG